MFSSVSFWEKQWLSKADIVVIGTGIVGLQCAQRLKEAYPHRQVWAIDRAPLSLGASMRNAGFACFGSMGEILDDIERTSEAEAIGLYEKRFRGISLLKEEYGETAMGYEKTGGYEIFEAGSENELEKIRENLNRINTLLMPVTGETSFIEKNTEKLGMRVLAKGIYTPHEGALQTHLLYKQIYQKTIAAGVIIHTGLTVKNLQEKPAGKWEINTEEGYDIACNQIVLCTNGFTKNLWPEAEVEPARGQVLVTTHIPGLQWRGLMHADKGYIYFRSLGTRILIGGARNMDFDGENTSEIGSNEPLRQRLLQFLQEIVIPGESFEVTHSWSGIMGMHQNRNPIVKMMKPNLFACVRMGGMGVALSALVSRQLLQTVQENN